MSHNHLPYSISPISFEDLHIDDGDNDDDDDDDDDEEEEEEEEQVNHVNCWEFSNWSRRCRKVHWNLPKYIWIYLDYFSQSAKTPPKYI